MERISKSATSLFRDIQPINLTANVISKRKEDKTPTTTSYDNTRPLGHSSKNNENLVFQEINDIANNSNGDISNTVSNSKILSIAGNSFDCLKSVNEFYVTSFGTNTLF